MKVAILAGGFGTRISEETNNKPKPMIEVGGRPILWHILKHYSHYGFNHFALALGYKAEVIKRYFLDYTQLNGNMTIDLRNSERKIHRDESENWSIHLEDTGLSSLTGDRIKKLKHYLSDDTFMVTYGDGVSDVSLDKLLAFHKKSGTLATVTAVRPPARFGGLILDGDRVSQFTEKPQIGEGWINGGFLVLEPAVLD
jgi:glucose-1-phosphate cytidylyltransferase